MGTLKISQACLVLASILLLQICHLKVEANSLTSAIKLAKGPAKIVAEKVADTAGEATAVEHKGGLRQKALHAGVEVAFDKGFDLVGVMYPEVYLASKVASPIAKKLAKPIANKIHSKINDLFQKPDGNGTSTSEAKAEVEDEANRVARGIDEANEKSASNEAHKGTEEPDKGEKKGLVDKIKSFVKGKDDEESKKDNDEDAEGKVKSTKDENESHKKNEKVDENKHDNDAARHVNDSHNKTETDKDDKGLFGKIKSLVDHKDDKEQADHKRPESSNDVVKEEKLDEKQKVKGSHDKSNEAPNSKGDDEQEASKDKSSVAEKKPGLMGKIKNLVKADGEKNEEKPDEKSNEAKDNEEGKKPGLMEKMKHLVKPDDNDKEEKAEKTKT